MEVLAPDIRVFEGPVVDFYSFPYSTRMVVIRLADGGLWVWSPIAVDDDLAAEVDAIGPVRHLVAPNKIHHLFLPQWIERWPEAKVWAPQSLIDKRQDIAFDGVLGDGAPPEWAGQIDQYHFANSRFLDEVDFVHLASGTVILTDLSENFSEAFIRSHWSWWQRPIARLWKIIEGWGYAPLELRATFRNRDSARAKLTQILAGKPQHIVMAHGEIVRRDGEAYLRQAFGWLLQ
ncbi:DUF4336 domain-containing protein [Tsuneonella mangrovi]|uniref:DUF4336 domain-containing protein n=1 Tax=Tsuneonella mangrovi TaxID=1982042 RepID=UPI000BA229AD|nr:DUF4336 domain-containing protein [Tsuneonella mangrovi]